MGKGPRRSALTYRHILIATSSILACCAAAAAQTHNGSLSGRLTDLWSHPVAGATVVLRNEATGSEARAITASNGMYRFDRLEPGAYAMVATSPSGEGELNGIIIAGGFQARVSAAMAFHAAAARVAAAPTLAANKFTSQPTQPAASIPESIAGSITGSITGSPEPRAAAGLVGLLRAHHGAELAPVSADLRADLPAASIESASLSPIAVAFPLAASAPESALPAAMSLVLESTEVSSSLPNTRVDDADVIAQPVIYAPQKSLFPLAKKTVQIATEHSEQDVAIAGEELQSLPLGGRDWSAFVLDGPQRAPRDNADGGEQLEAETGAMTVEGQRAGSEFFTQRSARGASGMPENFIAEQSVGEVRISSATDADLRDPAQPILATQRGSNQLHGQAFLFDRHNLLAAQNPFAQWVKETAPATATSVPQFGATPHSPGDQRLTWGLGAGGRLPHRRGTWFAALDGDMRNNPAVATPRHAEDLFAQPSNDEMEVLSARLRLSVANPVSEGLQEYSKVLEELAGLMGPADRSSRLWTGFARIDLSAGERNRLSFEANASDWHATGGGLTRVSEPYGSHSFGSPKSSGGWLLGRWEAFLTPNLLATTAGAFRSQTFAPEPQKPSEFEQGLMANLWGQLPQMVVDSKAGFTIGNQARFGTGTYPQDRGIDLQQRLDWVHGSLLLKGGFEYLHNASATSMLRNHYGTYVYSRAENFASDVLAFEKFGLADALDPQHQHNCDQRGRAWRDARGRLQGMGNLPCYSYYTQTLGPAQWQLSSNDWSGWMTAQWQPAKSVVIAAALRWDRQEVPRPIALVNNPDLPLTQSMPVPGNEWGPRASLAWGLREGHWPVLKIGYGAYYGRTSNAVLEDALTQTGSLKGNLRYFVRPTDNLSRGNAPAFPYVFAGIPGTVQKPSALEFAPHFRNPEIHQGEVAIEESLPGRVVLDVAAMASLGRRLPMVQDTNIDPATNPGTITYAVVDASRKGPIQAPQITVPFYATWPNAVAGGRQMPNYQQISAIASSANSTYEALQVRVLRSASHGVTVRARYTWGQAWDWNPDETSAVMGSSVFDPKNLALENGRSDLDVRHSVSGWVNWDAAWRHTNERWWAQGWRASVVGSWRSGLPFTMRTASAQPQFSTLAGATIVGLGPSMNGFGGDNRVYGVGRNAFRYPGVWKADVRLGRRIALGHNRELELLAESYNLFNHQNVTQLESIGYYFSPGNTSGSLPTLNFMTGMKSGQTEFGKALNVNAADSYRERQFDFGLRLRFRLELSADDWDY